MKLTIALLGFVVASSALANTEIVGDWETNCRLRNDLGYKSTISFVVDAETKKSTYSWKFLSYLDKDCKTLGKTREYPGTYVLGDVYGDGVALDIVLGAFNYTAHDQADVDKLNESKYCGFTDWEINVKKNIGGLTCDGKKNEGTGEVYFDLVKVDTVDGVTSSVYGATTDEEDGSTAEKRPKTLDMEAKYILIK